MDAPATPGRRNYSSVSISGSNSGSREQRMDALIQALWDALRGQGVSWIGIYLGPGQTTDDGRIVGPDEMLLGPNRPKPACSPLGLHGACGQCWSSGKPLVVRNVKDLGEAYVACDPRDASEVVIPLFDESGACYGVLDADSWEVGAFTGRDAEELVRLCRDAGLSY